MIDHFIPLMRTFITDAVVETILYPIFVLYFIASVPGLIRLFTSWR